MNVKIQLDRISSFLVFWMLHQFTYWHGLEWCRAFWATKCLYTRNNWIYSQYIVDRLDIESAREYGRHSTYMVQLYWFSMGAAFSYNWPQIKFCDNNEQVLGNPDEFLICFITGKDSRIYRRWSSGGFLRDNQGRERPGERPGWLQCSRNNW